MHDDMARIIDMQKRVDARIVESTERELIGVDFADMKPRLTDGYIVKGLLARETLGAVIGPSGSGKTFFVDDLACHIACGREWRGHRVQRGAVVCCELEGAGSAENRFAGWRQKHMPDGGTLPLRMMASPINLRSDDDVAKLTAFVKAAELDFGEPIALVVIDTLSRAMAGGDENGSEDMTALIAGADSIKTATGACVLLVHHMGKDESRGARGHSSLKAALDTEIEVTTDGETKIATVTKQRDYMSGTKYGFTLSVVELGHDQDGDAVTTCVVEHTDDVPSQKKPNGKNQNALLAGLHEWRRKSGSDAITGAEIREVGRAQNLKRGRFQEAVQGLERLGFLKASFGGYHLHLEDVR